MFGGTTILIKTVFHIGMCLVAIQAIQLWGGL